MSSLWILVDQGVKQLENIHVQTSAEERWGQSITLVHATRDGDVCTGPQAGLQSGLPQPRGVWDEGSQGSVDLRQSNL